MKMTKALFALQQICPYITNADFLKEASNSDLKDALSKELDNPGSFKLNDAMVSKLDDIYQKHIQEAQQRKQEQTLKESPLSESQNTSASSSQLDMDNDLKLPKDTKYVEDIRFNFQNFIQKHLTNFINTRKEYPQNKDIKNQHAHQQSKRLNAKRVLFAITLLNKVSKASSTQNALEIISSEMNSNKGILSRHSGGASLLRCLNICKIGLLVRQRKEEQDLLLASSAQSSKI